MQQTVYIINRTDPQRLAEVKAEMEIMGTPTIRVYDNGDCYIALEGSHRIKAAAELGLVPNWVEIGYEDEMQGHDLCDVDSNKVADLLDYIGFGEEAVRFEDY